MRSWTSGHYDTDFGTIAVDWKRQNDRFIYNVTVPAQIDYSFDFVDMEILEEKQNGQTYTFRLK